MLTADRFRVMQRVAKSLIFEDTAARSMRCDSNYVPKIKEVAEVVAELKQKCAGFVEMDKR